MCDIMIVDDDKSIHTLLELQLKKTDLCGGNCELAHAYSAEEAIELVGKLDHRPFIFFVDINLPQKSGPEFVEWLHEKEVFALIFIVTGSDVTPIEFEKLITAGVDGYFRKPINQNLLKTIVGMTLTKATKLGRKHARMFHETVGMKFDNSVLDNIIEKSKHLNILYEEFHSSRQGVREDATI